MSRKYLRYLYRCLSKTNEFVSGRERGRHCSRIVNVERTQLIEVVRLFHALFSQWRVNEFSPSYPVKHAFAKDLFIYPAHALNGRIIRPRQWRRQFVAGYHAYVGDVISSVAATSSYLYYRYMHTCAMNPLASLYLSLNIHAEWTNNSKRERE